MKGVVESVDVVFAGVDVQEAVLAGATEVVCVDAVDLVGADGQQSGQLLLPSGAVVDYVSVDLDEDVVTFAAPLPEALGELDRLLVVPQRSHTLAVVTLDDGGSIPARAEHTMQQALPAGVREGGGEVVNVEMGSGGEFEVTNIEGRPPLEVWGDPDGARVEINPDGVRVYRIGPNGAPYEATTLTGTDTAVTVVAQDGTVLGGLTSEGHLFGQRADVQSLRVGGLDVLGQLGGSVQSGWLDNLPRGLVRSGALSTSTSNDATERVYARVDVTLHPGRRYRVVGWIYANIGNVGALRARIRFGTGPSARVTTSSTTLGEPATSGVAYTANTGMDQRVDQFHRVDVTTGVQFAITYEGLGGATPGARRGRIYVEDVGPIDSTTGDDDDGTAVLYQSTWTATASRRYDKTGSALAGEDGKIELWAWHAEPTAFESSAWIYGGGAVESTHTTELGRTLPQALSGATLHRAEIYLHNMSFYDREQGYVSLASLASATLPTSRLIDGSLFVGDLAPGMGVWVEVPTSWFTNGANRGVQMGDKDGYFLDGSGHLVPLISGAFHGINDQHPPLARFTYTR